MKILAIRLKNLASLAGPFELDFTAEPLASLLELEVATVDAVVDVADPPLHATTPTVTAAATTVSVSRPIATASRSG